MFTHDKVDDMLSLENWQIEMLERRCGLSHIEAIDAVSFGVDYHDLETFQHEHPECSKHMAISFVHISTSS